MTLVSPPSGSLVDKKGKILVPGMYEDVAKVTDEEKKLYEKIDFDMVEYAKDVGAGKLLHDTKVWMVMFKYFRNEESFVLSYLPLINH